MIHLAQNVDLGPTIQGIETAAANAFDVAFLTANWTAAFSLDAGKNFNEISPYDLLKPLGLSFCCDQGVTYEPRIDTFLWVLLSPVRSIETMPEPVTEPTPAQAELEGGLVEGTPLPAPASADA